MPFAKLPKIELHLHLDCSLSYEVVQQINPTISFQTYRQQLMIPPKCTNLAEYISYAKKGAELMQTKEELRLVTFDLIKQLVADQVIYAEIRFAPLLHVNDKLTPYEVVHSVNAAVEEGVKSFDIDIGIILCTLRHFTTAQSMTTVQLVEEFKGAHVVGFDIAADEAAYSLAAHIKAFDYARAKDIPCTAHAGEAAGANSVWETLKQLQVQRIGHGVRSIEDSDLVEYIKRNAVHLEICPTSNVCTNVVPTFSDHPINQLYQKNISLSISTDARSFMDLDLNKEYQHLVTAFQWTQAHFLRCNLEAIQYAFTSEAKKAKLHARLLQAYA